MPMLLALALVFALAPSCDYGNILKSSPSTEDSDASPSGDDSSDDDSSDDGSSNSEDLSADYSFDQDEVVMVSLDDSGGSIEPIDSGASLDSSVLTISAPGTYQLSGSLSDGQIYVNSVESGTVRLIFNGVSLVSLTSSALYCEAADKLVIILAEGSSNSLSDGTSRSSANLPSAAIDSEAYMAIAALGAGTGSLVVEGRNQSDLDGDGDYDGDGISGSDGLVINSGVISISAPDDGLRGKDYVIIEGGSLEIQAESGDGIISDYGAESDETDEDRGYVSITDAQVEIVSGDDGIQAQSYFYGLGGEISVESTDKGICCAKGFSIRGGSISVDSLDDCINCDGDGEISGGSLALTVSASRSAARSTALRAWAGNDDSSSDGRTQGIKFGYYTDSSDYYHGSLTISGGSIVVEGAEEGIGGYNLEANGGIIDITASNDCLSISASTTTDGTESDDGSSLTIDGASVYLTISGTGDGLDSNGDFTMKSGLLVVQGPSSQPEESIDVNGGFIIEGGSLIASGYTYTKPDSLDQATVSISLSGAASAKEPGGGTSGGTTSLIGIFDSDDNLLFCYQPANSSATLLVSLAELELGETYTVYTGGSYSGGTNSNGLIQGASYSGGESLCSFSLSSLSSLATAGQ